MGHNSQGLLPPRRSGRAEKNDEAKEKALKKKAKGALARERQKRSQKRSSPANRKKARRNSPAKERLEGESDKESELQVSSSLTKKLNSTEHNPDGGDAEPECQVDGMSTPQKSKDREKGMNPKCLLIVMT